MAATLMEKLEGHHSDSWGWALACCNWQGATAEDALQESYLRVLDGRARYRGDSSPKTWFFGVVKRVAAEQRRSQLRHGLLNLKYLLPANDAEDDPSFDAVEEDDSSRQLRQALQAMSARQREVLHLVFYSGLTLEETARTLGMTLGSARTHYHRGKSRLAQLLELDNG
jgi:RNA polymerase sigma-70 factor, ECF subfamily